MRSKNYSVLMIGLLALGFLVVNHATPWGPAEAQAQGEPIIQFVAPAGTPRYMDTADPIDPGILIDVEVNFPAASTPCAGTPLPVDPSSLVVTLQQMVDSTPNGTSWDVDESTWAWNPAGDNVTGQVTIGGPSSGMDRILYGINVCISNASASVCATKGIRVEYPVSGFTAGLYISKGNNFGQSGAGCNLIPSIAIPFLNEQMAAKDFLTIVPSGPQIAAGGAVAEFIGIPLIGSMLVPTVLNTGNNDVDLTEKAVSGIDLSGIGFPGTNCEISGKADGSLMGGSARGWIWMEAFGSTTLPWGSVAVPGRVIW
jgi:hypothetical protein